MTGIVFRKPRSRPEREAVTSLLADSGVPPAAIRGAGDTVLYGLWDLAAPTGEGLVGVAATRMLDDAGSVELCGIAVLAAFGHRGLGYRLVTEVADALRVEGARRLVAKSADRQSPATALLARAGFVAAVDADGQPGETDVGWLYLEL
jgi:GNAT superfamily N-acetyltransferase